MSSVVEVSQMVEAANKRLADVAWGAGLFDGEGSIRIEPREDRGPSCKGLLILRVNMMHEATISRLLDIFKGGRKSKCQQKTRTGGTATVHTIRWNGPQKAAPVLKEMLPHLTTKREQAEIALKFESAPKGPSGSEVRKACQKALDEARSWQKEERQVTEEAMGSEERLELN